MNIETNGFLDVSKSRCVVGRNWTWACRALPILQLRSPTLVFSILVALCNLGIAQINQESSPAHDELRVHIGHLIEQLSDPNYSSRLSAQSELERIGVLALDQLHAASFHPDPQIASTARFVVQSNQFSWSWDTDPVSVRQILKNYSAADSEKSMYIDKLQSLDHDEGFPALCRLVRYETRSGLAKRAALILMRSRPPVGQTLEARKESIRNYIGGGQSQASRWMIQFASLGKDFDLNWWEKTIADEVRLLKAGSVETNLDLVLDLHKWVVEQLAHKPETRSAALSLGKSILSLSKSVPTLDSMTGNRSTRANEFAQWALKNKLPELVQEQHAKLSKSILAREFFFGYLLAESFKLQANETAAAAIALHSLNQIACSELGAPIDPIATDEQNQLRALDFSANRQLSGQVRRYNIAQKLEERGQFDWAEAEFRLALNDDLTNFTTLDGMRDLAAMLQTQGKHLEAIQVLEPFLVRYENEPMFKRQLDDPENKLYTQVLLSNYYLYCGDRDRERNETEKAAKNYWLSIEREPENVDAIIGLYRLALPESDRDKLRLKLAKTIAESRSQIRQDEARLKGASPGDHASYSLRLATHCNNLAWVIVNTEGSKEEALFLSRKACLLSPDTPENLDTLAYCYAAMERYEEAVEQQKLAVELKPHHPEFSKALKRFEAKRESQKATAPKGKSP